MRLKQTHISQRCLRGLALSLSLCLCTAAEAGAGERIFRCLGRHGEPVFRDQPCSRAGLPRMDGGRAELPTEVRSGLRLPAGCGFSSEPLLFFEPELGSTELRLVVDIDDEGPYLFLEVDGDIRIAESPAVVATFDARLGSQGLQFADGSFITTDWRMGQQRLGFGRSRMRSLLTALSQQPGNVVVWIEGLASPAIAETMPPEEFRLAVDNARRCHKTRIPVSPAPGA